nr:hypothetical protein GCM10020093_058670 [Planobispora longispora]
MYLKEDDVDVHGRPIDPALRGMYCHAMSPALTTVLEFDPVAGTVADVARLYDPDRYWQAELSALDWSLEGQLAPTRHHLVFQGFQPEAVNRRALRNYGARVDRSLFPAEQTPAVLASLERDTLKPLSEWAWALDDYPTSPVFVPRSPGGPAAAATRGPSPAGTTAISSWSCTTTTASGSRSSTRRRSRAARWPRSPRPRAPSSPS